MAKNYLLGIDIGTTGTRSLVINEDGSIIGSAVKEYPLYTPQTWVGWARTRRLVWCYNTNNQRSSWKKWN